MATAKLDSYQIEFENGEEYHHLKQEIFTQDAYYFETDNPTPLIIDAGAHIGIATLYFKKLYPGSRVVALEPHPENFKLLEANIFENQLTDVTAIETALDSKARTADFFADASKDKWFSTASFTKGAWNGEQKSLPLSVPTRPLSDFLTEPVDFLKMDIEGAEQAVLQATGSHLKTIHQMMIEYHPVVHQSLPKLLKLLEDLSYQIKLWKKGKEVSYNKARGLILIEAIQA